VGVPGETDSPVAPGETDSPVAPGETDRQIRPPKLTTRRALSSAFMREMTPCEGPVAQERSDEQRKRLGRREAVAVRCCAGRLRCGAVAVRCCPWRTERARDARGERVVVSATPIRAGGAESTDMSLSDRERAEGFQPSL